MAGREEMLSRLADADEHFAECLLSDSKQHDESAFDAEVANALRRATLARNIVPVACGTALRLLVFHIHLWGFLYSVHIIFRGLKRCCPIDYWAD